MPTPPKSTRMTTTMITIKSQVATVSSQSRYHSFPSPTIRQTTAAGDHRLTRKRVALVTSDPVTQAGDHQGGGCESEHDGHPEADRVVEETLLKFMPITPARTADGSRAIEARVRIFITSLVAWPLPAMKPS